MNTNIKLAVFDLAGTVVDYGSCAPAGAFTELFKRHGIEVTLTQSREPMGMHKRDHIRTMLEMPAISGQWVKVKGHQYTADELEALFNEFIPLQLECLPEYSQIIEGAAESANQLREMGIKLAATTGYNREMMDIVLDALKSQGLEFDVSCCAAEVPAGRPAPWMIYRCMEASGVYPVSAVINFGDTVADVASGKNAGVFSVGVVRSGNMLGMSKDELEKTDKNQLKELMDKGEKILTENGADMVVPDVSFAVETLKRATL